MALIPNEQYMIRKETQHRDRKGILGLTNFRLIWISEGSATPEVILKYTHIKDIDKVVSEDSRISYLKIKRKDFRVRSAADLLFIFTSETHSEDLQTCNDYIQSFMNKPQKHDDLYSLSTDTQAKIKILEKNSELNEIHKLLVRTGKMTEDHFWKTSDEYQQYLKEQVHSLQIPGKLTSIVRIPHRFISNNQVVVDILIKHKKSIFRQLPHVRISYLHTVPHRKSEIEFWRNFWEHQLSLGSAMSDALEITGEVTLNFPSYDENEEIESCHGIFQPNFKLSNNFLQITQQVNNHSCYVISTAEEGPKLIPQKFIGFNYTSTESQAMEIDTGLQRNEQWGNYISEAFKIAKPESVFISSADAFDTIRQIFQQTYITKPRESEENSNACIYAMKIYQVLKYFYAEYPVPKDKFEILEVIIDISIQVFNEMRSKCYHKDSVLSMETMIGVANERLQQIKQGIN